MRKGKVEIIKDEWSGKLDQYFDIDISDKPIWINEELNHTELLKPIPKDFLDDVTVSVKDREGTLVIMNDSKKELELEITSWVGISPGAVHSYGTLKLRSIDIHPNGEPNRSVGGYLGAKEDEFPLAFKFVNLKIKIVRPIEQRDLDHADGDRYHGYRLGEYTRDWWEEKDLIKEGKRIAKEFFPEYKLEIDV